MVMGHMITGKGAIAAVMANKAPLSTPSHSVTSHVSYISDECKGGRGIRGVPTLRTQLQSQEGALQPQRAGPAQGGTSTRSAV